MSQFIHDPRKQHISDIDHILKYMKYAPRKGLLFLNHDQLKVEGCSVADWADSSNRRTTSSYFTFVDGNHAAWRSKKQPVVARSSAEYRGMTFGVCELLWLTNLLTDLGFKPKEKINLQRDKKFAIPIAHNHV